MLWSNWGHVTAGVRKPVQSDADRLSSKLGDHRHCAWGIRSSSTLKFYQSLRLSASTRDVTSGLLRCGILAAH